MHTLLMGSIRATVRRCIPLVAFITMWGNAAYADTTTLQPAALKGIAIAGNAGAPTFAVQDVGATYEVRARDFASLAVRGNLVYQRFDLSPLGDAVIQTAAITFNRVAGDSLTTSRVSLYGLQDMAGNLPQSWTPDSFSAGAEFDPAMFYDLVASTGACPVNLANVVDFSQQETVSGDQATLASNDFVSFLQARLAPGGQATILLGMPSQGAGNDKKITFAYPGYTDPKLPVSLVIGYTPAGLPPPPSNFVISSISYFPTPSLTLDWDSVDGAIAYRVYRRAAGEASPSLVAISAYPSFFDMNVALFGTYYYSVVTVTAKNESLPSNEFEVRVIDTTLGAPAAPEGLVASSTSPTSIDLSWNPVPNALFYEIYRSTEIDGAFSLVQTVESENATDGGLQGFRSYYYRAKTISAGGISRYSDTLTVPPRFTQGPHVAKPKSLSAPARSGTSIDLVWTASSQAEAYYVYRSTQIDGDSSLVGITETNAFTDTFAVYPQNAYYYSVYAVGGAGFSRPSELLAVNASLTNYKQVERLRRAPIAIPTAEGVFLSWRLLGTDPDDIAFRVYRDGHPLNQAPIRGVTNFLDVEGSFDSVYEVRPAFGPFEFPPKETATMLSQGYLGVPIQPPPAGVTPDGLAFTYTANDATVADLDGDGVYEIVLKWDPTNSKDNASDGYTGNTILDAYKLDGQQLWRIDLGRNIRAGAHYSPFLVYDFDGDGRAELICKTADATVDGRGVVLGDPSADYRNAKGRILTGPEFLTLFDGATGGALQSVDYIPPRGDVTDWGDDYGNRSERFNAGIAYLDGVHPSAFFERGYYRGQPGMGTGITVVAAFDVKEELLVNRWVFDTRVAGADYIGQGNHQVAASDLDGDGKDEIVLGSLVLDDTGSVLYSTNLGHGDAMHIGDLDPTRPGLEMFSVKEDASVPYQDVLTDAATGRVFWGVFNGADTGRGLAADIDPTYAGEEVWGAANVNVWSVKGTVIGQKRPSSNFAIWWDGDPLRELLDGTSVRKWDWQGEKEIVLLDAEGTAANNGTKATPCLQADLLGDWREELVLRSADNTQLRIYSTSNMTDRRIPTLMQDPQYRVAVAAQNSGYNQPPHPSFFIGNNMPAVGTPKVFVDPVPELVGLVRDGEAYVGPVIVILNVNQGDELQNLYRIDEGEWFRYWMPFVVLGRGHHRVAFRTLDARGNLLAEAARQLTIASVGP